MNLTRFAFDKKILMTVLTIFLMVAGIWSYLKLGRLEDPNFTIKTAVVATRYPGATPYEVEEEVTDVVEEAIQSMGQIKEIYSTSEEGLSTIFVDIQDQYQHDELSIIWQQLRSKVADVQKALPPGAGPSMVNDDFGDVYGIFFAITGPQYNDAELKKYAKILKKELLLCEDVAKVDLWGTRQEVIYVEFQLARLAQLGISPFEIMQTLRLQNVVQESGKIKVDERYLRITPSGSFDNEKQIAKTLIGHSGNLVKLGDIANIYRDYLEPRRTIMRFNGKPAIGLGVSCVTGGNVITMGTAINQKLDELQSKKPADINLDSLYYQSNIVTEAVNIFVVNLIEAVIIVIVLLMLFMGWRSGLLIGVILLLTILATFIGMLILGIDLQKISLGALILALGMLVDNAIVVTDGILVRTQSGEDRKTAALKTVDETSWPLFGATIIAILAFTPIGFSPGNVGEFCRSLFDVMALSLSFSWILAVTITPLLCTYILPSKQKEHEETNPYNGPVFRSYRKFLHYTISWRWLTLGFIIILLGFSVFAFRWVPKAFFPDSTQKYFFVEYWKPQGTHIDQTSTDLQKIETFTRNLQGVKNVSTFVGEGTLRFLLCYNYEKPNSSYGQLLVEVDDCKNIGALQKTIEQYLKNNFPAAEPFTSKISNGPAVPFKIEVRFRGPEPEVLHALANQATAIMHATPNTENIRTDWRQMMPVMTPVFSEVQARQSGVTRTDLSNAMQWHYNGITGGLYRERDELLPIILRASNSDRKSLNSIEKIQVWSLISSQPIPIRQVITDIKTTWEAPLIQRRNRQRCVTVKCNPITGQADALRFSLKKEMEAIPLPAGYEMEWGGEFEESVEAQAPLTSFFPICFLVMFILTVWLFNSVRRPLVIFLVLPLSMIGISSGLLLTRLPFGFMSILGFLGLSGMLIKNAVVLIDQINLEQTAGSPLYKAILDASVSRMRPVIMASGTTILGMAPLVFDPFYASMAATIMSGLAAGTFLTLIVVPVLYSLMYHIKPEKQYL